MCSLVLTFIFGFPLLLMAASNSANEIRSEVSECLGNGRTSDHVTTPLKQHQFVLHPPYEHGMIKASNFPFSSLPTMHINEQENHEDVQSLENQHSLPCDPGRRVIANSCPESVACGESPGIFILKDFPPHHIEGYARRKYFTPHWSMEATNDAIEVNLLGLNDMIPVLLARCI